MNHILTGLALLSSCLAAPAAANPDLKRRDVAVNVADLDLTTREGRAALDRRIEKAVLKACGTAHYLEAEKLADLDKCRAEARQRVGAVRAKPRSSTEPVLSLSNGDGVRPAGGAVSR